MHTKPFSQCELIIMALAVMVLSALAIPAVKAARETARKKACMGQLNKIGHVQHLYLKDNNGYFYPWQGVVTLKTIPNPGTSNWIGKKAFNYRRVNGYQKICGSFTRNDCHSPFVPLAMGYMDQDFASFYCPADFRLNLNPCGGGSRNSYAYIWSVLGSGQSRKYRGSDTPNINQLRPKRQILFGESSQGYGFMESKPQGKGRPGHGSWFFYNTDMGIQHAPHGDGYNFLFVDGHVETWKLQNVIARENCFNTLR